MKQLVTGAAVAIALGLGAISTVGTTAPARTSSAKAPSAKAVRRPATKATRPQQGYRCPTPAAGAGKAAPPGAAIVERLRLTRLSRPTPTSAVVRADATVAAPKGAEIIYTYSITGGRVTGDGPRVTWTLEEAGTWTISLEVYNRTSGCTTFTSASYTIPAPRPKQATSADLNNPPAKPQWEIDYEQRMALYQQELAKQRQAVADYERQTAEVEARRAELRRRAEESQAQWRAAVAACQAGDYSRCSGTAPR